MKSDPGKILFEDMGNIIEKLNLTRLNLNMDHLYHECIAANTILPHLFTNEDWESKGTSERWMVVLQTAPLPNMQSVVSFVLSIPSSTGYAESVLSNEEQVLC